VALGTLVAPGTAVGAAVAGEVAVALASGVGTSVAVGATVGVIVGVAAVAIVLVGDTVGVGILDVGMVGGGVAIGLLMVGAPSAGATSRRNSDAPSAIPIRIAWAVTGTDGRWPGFVMRSPPSPHAMRLTRHAVLRPQFNVVWRACLASMRRPQMLSVLASLPPPDVSAIYPLFSSTLYPERDTRIVDY